MWGERRAELGGTEVMWHMSEIGSWKEDKMTGELLDWTRHAILRKEHFDKLISIRQALSTEKKDVELQLKETNEEISGLMATLEEPAVLCDGWKVTLSEGMRKSLKKDRLLSLGVSIETIDEATVETAFTTLRVTEVKA